MIPDILVSFILQIVFTVGLIVSFGFLIALCNKRFYANLGSYGRKACYITGVIGTPVHECAHALFCIIFGHKITEIKLFQVNSADGMLGYVNHKYNPKSVYQKIGNFFIGVAPIIVISAVLYLLARLILPRFVEEAGESFLVFGAADGVGDVFLNLFKMLGAFFKCAATWQWWVYVFLGSFLALHMTLSKADIKGASSGAVFLLVALFVADVILAVCGLLKGFTHGVLAIGGFLLCFLVLSLIISLFALAVSYIFRALRRR